MSFNVQFKILQMWLKLEIVKNIFQCATENILCTGQKILHKN
jgi:hypothetical protein